MTILINLCEIQSNQCIENKSVNGIVFIINKSKGGIMSFLYQVIDGSLKIPGVKIDRTAFLQNQLSQFLPDSTVQEAIRSNPSAANIPQRLIDRIALSTSKNHIRVASAASFALGLPGGAFVVASIPVDASQFFAQVIILAQKLAYLYGWPDFDDENNNEVLIDMLMMFFAVMLSVQGANKLMINVANRFAIEIAKRVPRIALTKFAWYKLLKVVLKWVGVKVTKDAFAKSLAKIIPVVGGVVSGGITYTMMSTMSKRLIKQLKETDLNNIDRVNIEVDANEIFDIEIEDLDLELDVIEE